MLWGGKCCSGEGFALRRQKLKVALGRESWNLLWGVKVALGREFALGRKIALSEI
ncbi:MAG TPA: hypothetical protein PLG16_09450 [Planctomycetota bacterium]|nr:hypothetical protein [Planctomycetota bacterium]